MTDIQNSRPFVLMMSEITVDGKLTLFRGASSKILMKYMSHESEILLHTTRAEVDAIMVGSRTIAIDNSFLTVRLVKGKSPLRVIPNSRADISPDANVLSGGVPTLIAVSEKAPVENIRFLEARGAIVRTYGKDKVDLPLLLHSLYEDFGVKRMMIEGGPTLNRQMIKARLIDEIRLVHLPFIVGGDDTPSLVGGDRIESEDEMTG